MKRMILHRGWWGTSVICRMPWVWSWRLARPRLRSTSSRADVVATDAKTGSRVLIENQLEPANHRHLGQVLTYLAGLEAKVVIWIARDFDEAHRSAVRWLNDHTTDEFAFFAVRMRVVRIGDSPFAPIFEVLEKPNAWERALERKFRKADSELTRLRKDFWERYLERQPGCVPAEPVLERLAADVPG